MRNAGEVRRNDAGKQAVDAVQQTADGERVGDVRRVVLAAVGMSFVWSRLGSAATMSFRHAMAGSACVVPNEWHAAVMGVFYLVAIALCLAARDRVAHRLAGPSAPVAALLLGLVGLAGNALLVWSPSVASAPLATGAVLAGFALIVAFVVGHLLGWGFVLQGMPVLRAMLVVVASNALAFGCQLALFGVARPLLLGYLVLCPVGSAVCLRACLGPARRTGRPVPETGGPTAAPSLADTSSLAAALRGVPWKLVVPVVALIYFEQVFSSLLFQRYESWPEDNLMVTLAVSCAIWVAASALFARAGRSHADRPQGAGHVPANPQTLLTVLLAVLLVVYLAALLAVVLLPQSDRLLVERLLVAAGTSLRVLLWLAVTEAVARGATTPVVGYLCYVLFVCALPVSRLASALFGAMDPALVASLATPTVIVPAAGVMLFLIAVASVVSGLRAPRDAADTQLAEAPDPRAEACRALAEQAGLSAREAEVLELVCRGYTARHAGERLGISESTVVSHLTHIYRKAGVSSKQDLVALVEKLAG